MIFFWLYNIRNTTYRIEAKLNFNIDVYEKYILSIDSHQISVFKKIVICLWRTFISFLQRFSSFCLSLSQTIILDVAFNMGFSYQIYICWLFIKVLRHTHHEWLVFSFTFPTPPPNKMAIFVSMKYKEWTVRHQRTRESTVLFTDVTSFTTTNVDLVWRILATILNLHSMSCVNWKCMVSFIL